MSKIQVTVFQASCVMRFTAREFHDERVNLLAKNTPGRRYSILIKTIYL